MPFVELSAVTKAFDGVAVINQVDCGVEKGEFFCILGPSGCGKSTLLRLIAGLEKLDGGTITVGGKRVSDSGVHVAPESRNVGIVFQSYALWPHMTVAGNVEYPLRTAKADPTRRREETAQALRSVHMTDFADRRPHTLSGGQQQRVALARCLTQKPAVVLMDEPLANLDMHLRGEMLREFREFRDSSDSTIIYITHDQSEAMSVADRIAVMFEGPPCAGGLAGSPLRRTGGRGYRALHRRVVGRSRNSEGRGYGGVGQPSPTGSQQRGGRHPARSSTSASAPRPFMSAKDRSAPVFPLRPISAGAIWRSCPSARRPCAPTSMAATGRRSAIG